MAEITIQQTDVAVSVTDTAVNVLPIVSQVVIETATSATLAVVDPINYDNATIGLNVGNNLEVVNGNLTTTETLDNIDKIIFDLFAAPQAAAGELVWNDTDGTLNLGLKGGNVTLQIGQELVQLVKDADNAGIVNGAAYYLVGSDGSNVTVRKALASGEATSSKTFGIATEASNGGAKAFLTTFGMVRDIDTSALTEGAIVWLSPTVPGGLTTTKPSAPNHAVMLGLCVKSHANNGMVFVSVNNGLELEELHDVAITSVQNNDLLAYDSATSLWKNVQLSTLGDSRYARLGAANAFTVGGQSITNADAAVVPLYIRAATGQTGDLQQWQIPSGGVVVRVLANGQLRLGTSIAGTAFSVNNDAYGASVIGQVIRGAASQSADLTIWQNSTPNTMAGVTSLGGIYTTNRLSVGFSSIQTAAIATISTISATNIGQVIRGAASQSANLLELQNSSGTVLISGSASGGLNASGNIISTNGQVIAGNGFSAIGTENSGGKLFMIRATAATANPGANRANLYLRDGTVPGTLKLVVRAGAAGAETTILDNIPQ